MGKSYREGKNLSSGPEKFASRQKALGIMEACGVLRSLPGGMSPAGNLRFNR
jgi:hypothetical protein